MLKRMQKDHLDHVAMTTGGVSGVRVIKEMCRATFRDSQYIHRETWANVNTHVTYLLLISALFYYAAL